MAEIGPQHEGDSARGPFLRKQGYATQLIVDGKPFLVLGGELHNSSSSDLAYMQPIWERMVALHLNTLLVPVSWELVEPTEGVFDFTLVDGLVDEARRHTLHLILLWFGSWKNGMSSYVPLWVKRDYSRFPLAKLRNGRTVPVLSTFAEANWKADARAFAALMRHIREIDGHDHTVIMVQVENEVGLLGDSRDHCEAANRAFTEPVPPTVFDQLHQPEIHNALRERWEAFGSKLAGDWEAVFGSGPETDELFMAWNYACYLDRIAAAGKAEYDIPLFANTWLNNPNQEPSTWASGGQQPGDWPSGGPVAHTLDIWRAGAPHIDLLSPDIYFGDFKEWCQQYTRRDNPLLIPEMRRDDEGARNLLYAIGQHNAIGTSPFGVDSIDHPQDSPIRTSYALLQQLAPLILAHQGMGTMTGFLLDEAHPSITQELGDYILEIALDHGIGSKIDHGYGIIIASDPDTCIGAGYGFRVMFRPITPGPTRVGIAAVDEGTYHNGQWRPGRRLNGDETFSGNMWRFPALNQPPSTFPIPILGANLGIARCLVYRYE